MSVDVSSREVLAHLNDLGYTHITADQLKLFIQDLKKLIKHDLKQKAKPEVSRPKAKTNKPTEFYSTLRTNPASAQTNEGKKESVISVEVKKYKIDSQSDCNSECVKPRTASKESCSCYQCNYRCTKHAASEPEIIGASKKSLPTKSSGKTSEMTLSSKVALKPKVSFIRPRLATHVRSCKSDPVALYHHYQAEWKKQKFPGEDNRADLRWAIREKMMGEPHPKPISATQSLDHVHRRRSCCRKA